ncbi:AraC family transcriptional regulator [Litoribrevibacter albus]|uniref:AraC family transcriptional regulator n=1 Tax=Litoribrevibacter albus TaxID=1473156 RepID=UPI0024E0BF26|nr:AraC family transcriptional regulator [Litoribrevibacter albus]
MQSQPQKPTHVQTLSTSTVSAIAVMDLADALVQREIIQKEELALISLELLTRYQAFVSQTLTYQTSTDQGPIQEQHLPEKYFIGLWQQLDKQDQATKVTMALRLGEHTETGRLGILANWLRHCSTLEEALATFIEHKALLNQSEHWQIVQHGDEKQISIGFDTSKAYPYIAVLRSFSSLVTWAKFLTGQEIAPKKMTLHTNDETTLKVLSHYFDCPVQGSNDHDTMVFNADIFQAKIITANSYLNELLGQQAKFLKQTLTPVLLSEKLVALLQSDLARYSKLSECLAELNMSRSTLFRKLKSEDTQFSELLDQARKEMHQKLASKGTPNAEISDALGFSEISAFYKFLKR